MGTRPCRLSGVGKDGKSDLSQATYSTFPTTPACSNPKDKPKDFALQKGADLSEQVSNLREKTAAESGWKQDVSNRL
ncbi:hypothetical protein [Desulfitobacterium dehalogenans]|uniref:hypothetical protein n=1 Tax=Desulfitobacterium dehalogenans TaxID=36854 RepID=UPI0013050EF0|nr:hypothetical protein [Desulfitobacterium dehalogenans]